MPEEEKKRSRKIGNSTELQNLSTPTKSEFGLLISCVIIFTMKERNHKNVYKVILRCVIPVVLVQ
jgi:hypothetical protein